MNLYIWLLIIYNETDNIFIVPLFGAKKWKFERHKSKMWKNKNYEYLRCDVIILNYLRDVFDYMNLKKLKYLEKTTSHTTKISD